MLGKNCNFQTLLVGTGKHNFDEVNSWHALDDESPEKKYIPDYFVEGLGHLWQLIKDL